VNEKHCRGQIRWAGYLYQTPTNFLIRLTRSYLVCFFSFNDRPHACFDFDFYNSQNKACFSRPSSANNNFYPPGKKTFLRDILYLSELYQTINE
jgi:hypothetical protein